MPQKAWTLVDGLADLIVGCYMQKPFIPAPDSPGNAGYLTSDFEELSKALVDVAHAVEVDHKRLAQAVRRRADQFATAAAIVRDRE